MIESMWESFKSTIWNAVWAANLGALSPVRAGLFRSLRVLHMVVRELGTGELTLRAMSLVYTTLLSLVPLLAVSFSVLKGFGVHDQLEPALLNVLAPLGEKAAEITARIVEFVENVRVGLLGSVGLALLLYTVISLIQKVERSFNYTWRVRQSRGLSQRFSDYMSVLLVGPLLVFGAIGLTATLAGSSITQRLIAIEPFGWLYQSASGLLPFVLVIAAFTFVYMYLPNTRVRLRPALTGAVIAGVLWQLVGWTFAAFVVSSTKTTAIYSSFAILVIFMVWLYLAWLILLVGASVAFYTQHPEYHGLLVSELNVSNRMKERFALASMFHIAERHYYGQEPLPLTALATRLRVPVDPVRDVLAALAKAGLVVEINHPDSAFVPARDLALITVEEILEVTRSANESIYLNQERLEVDAPVDAIFQSIERSREAALEGRTLRDIAAANPPAGGTAPPAQGTAASEDTSLPGRAS